MLEQRKGLWLVELLDEKWEMKWGTQKVGETANRLDG